MTDFFRLWRNVRPNLKMCLSPSISVCMLLGRVALGFRPGNFSSGIGKLGNRLGNVIDYLKVQGIYGLLLWVNNTLFLYSYYE